MNLKKLPELLAPAGSPASALAAFDAGADAVYAGLAKFNARERGENFDPDSLGKIIQYAHQRHRKVYVTTNTLIKENELPEMVEMLSCLNQLQPDALLVQDLGVLRIARDYFPQLTLHGSTQMALHNSSGAELAKTLGLSRIVLDRQLTMEEIRQIRKATDLELEVFIHGALCCSLSGCCYFSSHLGGSSGNRGKCKQPCRRRYYSKNGNGFFFSPQDLATLELIPELTAIGVQSLKIEGRLRQPDYVSAAVSAYRTVLDASQADFAEALLQARETLSRTCGRKWSTGFYFPESGETLIKHDSLGAVGVKCGVVENITEYGFGFTAKRRLSLGDRLRIQPPSGDDGPAVSLTKIYVDNVPAKRVKAGQRVFVCCDKAIPENGAVYKIGESIPDYSARLAALPERKDQIELEITLSRNLITVNSPNTILESWSSPLNLSPAERRPASPGQLIDEFSVTGISRLALGKCTVNITEDCFLPAQILKQLRKDYWLYAKEHLKFGGIIDDSGLVLEKFHRDYLAMHPDYQLPERLIETVALKPHGAEPADRKAIRADYIYDYNKLSSEVILPDFCPERLLPSLKKAIAAAYASGIRRFRIPSLYGFELLKEYDDIVRLASSPLPVCNSMAVLTLRMLGADRAMAHIELEKSSILELQAKSVLPLELYRLGRPALLTTRAKIAAEGAIWDNRGNEFEVRSDSRSGLSRLYARKVLSLPRLPGIFDYYDLTNATWRTTESESFNFDGNWL